MNHSGASPCNFSQETAMLLVADSGVGTRPRVVHAIAHIRREFFTSSLSGVPERVSRPFRCLENMGVVRPKIISS
jgi:hypothetical protein